MPSDVKPVIYQLVVRYFGNVNPSRQPCGTIETNGCGKFDDISAVALQSLRNLGATHVWLTGCLRQATLTDYSALGMPADDADVVKGMAGSFYAIRDYFDVSPDYATEPANRLAEFDALIQRVHAAGMKALIDFVPNHVARGYRSIVRPDLNFGDGDDTTKFFDPQNHFFYVTEPAGEPLRLARPAHWHPAGVAFDGHFSPEDGTAGRTVKVTGNNSATTTPSLFDWYETIKLNYGYDFAAKTGHYDPRPRTWDVMNEIIAYWQARGVDGVRCDFAHYVPAEAWTFLITEARRRDPDAYLLAEAYPYDGSGDPITAMAQLVEAGFDAVYHDDSYNRLKKIYQGVGSQEEYDNSLVALSADVRPHYLHYVENHDERRIASPVVQGVWTGDSGFGTGDAAYLLAPLQLLSGAGPVLVLNGQEVGEPGADREGFSAADGRTSLFDYWSMPEFAKWVNDHAYDGKRLSSAQAALRAFYGRLLQLCQDSAVRGRGFWGLKYFNRPEKFGDCSRWLYSYARFEDGAGRMIVVAANFDTSAALTTKVRIPAELCAAAGMRPLVSVKRVLARGAEAPTVVASLALVQLSADGFSVTLPAQSTAVYAFEPIG